MHLRLFKGNIIHFLNPQDIYNEKYCSLCVRLVLWLGSACGDHIFKGEFHLIAPQGPQKQLPETVTLSTGTDHFFSNHLGL